MKLLHIADLHIGKRVNGMSMIPEQEYVIDQLLSVAKDEGIDAVLIAGDVFDRPIPSREALETCERLFTALCDQGLGVFAIPGNHDSAQQLAFCSSLLAPAGLHIARAFDGNLEAYDFEAGGERVRIHLLPFVRPTDVRMALPELATGIATHDDAVRTALATAELDDEAPNLLVAHQFVTSGQDTPQTCDSEVLSVGGTDNVDASAFEGFDYVALGHLHGAQSVGKAHIRYAGSPLKYSFSEVKHVKSASILTIEGKDVRIEERELVPLHDMREICASYAELEAGADEGSMLDYMRVTLTDASLPDAMAKLRILYPNILRLDWMEFETREQDTERKAQHVKTATPMDLFTEYYELQTGSELTEEERALFADCLEELRR